MRAWPTARCSPRAAASRPGSPRGIAPGETVSPVMPNGLVDAAPAARHGVGQGACVNPVNLLAQPEQMRYVLEHSTARRYSSRPSGSPRVRELLAAPAPGGIGSRRRRRRLDCRRSPRRPIAAAPPEDLALLMYTRHDRQAQRRDAHARGQPRGERCRDRREHALGPADRVLGVLPLYHINAFAVTCSRRSLVAGSVAMAPKFSAARLGRRRRRAALDQRGADDRLLPAEGDAAASGASRGHPCASAARPRRRCRPSTCAASSRSSASASSRPWADRDRRAAFPNPRCGAAQSWRQAAPRAARRASTTALHRCRMARLASSRSAANVMRGQEPHGERAAFTPDGWLRTGDPATATPTASSSPGASRS